MTKPSREHFLNKCFFQPGHAWTVVLHILSLSLSFYIYICVIIFIMIMPISHQDFPLAFGSIISMKPVTIVLLDNPT